MKKRSVFRILTALVALMLVASVFAGCSAVGDSSTEIYPSDKNETAGGMDGTLSEGGKPGDLTGEFDRKIIRTVNMTCETMAYDDAITVIMTALSDHGGYVETSSLSGNTASGRSSEVVSARRAEYTLRVPAAQLDAFLEVLRADGGILILSQSMNSEEITGAYYDAKTRLETLNAEKESLTAMLESFTDYGDMSAMLQVQERLYNVIEEMEALQTRLNLYDSQVSMSTVNLTLREVVEFTEVEEPTFGTRIQNAFIKSWRSFGRGCQNLAVWFVAAFPTLLVLAVLGTATPIIVVKIVRRSKRRRMEAYAAQVPPQGPQNPPSPGNYVNQNNRM